MQKIAISLIALAALSGAALAERSYDLRDLETINGHSSAGVYQPVSPDTAVDTNAAAIVGANDGGMLTPYERALKNAEDNDNGNN